MRKGGTSDILVHALVHVTLAMVLLCVHVTIFSLISKMPASLSYL